MKRPGVYILKRGNFTSKKNIFLIGTIFVLFLFLITSCATVGKDFSAINVSKIKIGQTTQNEIRTLFGSPWRVGIEDGQTTWTYGKYNYGAFGKKKATDLVIKFDDNNIVSSYTYSTTEHSE